MKGLPFSEKKDEKRGLAKWALISLENSRLALSINKITVDALFRLTAPLYANTESRQFPLKQKRLADKMVVNVATETPEGIRRKFGLLVAKVSRSGLAW